MRSPPFDPYRPPVEPPSPPSPSASSASAASLLLVDVALVPFALGVIEFALPMAAIFIDQPPESTVGVDRLLRDPLLVGGVVAAVVGVARLRRLPEGRHVSLALRMSLGILLAATVVAALFRFHGGLPMLRAVRDIAVNVREGLARPLFTILLALCCRRMIGAGAHPALVYSTILASVANVGFMVMSVVNGKMFTPTSDPQRMLINWLLSVAVLGAMVVPWLAPSLLLWKLRDHLRRAPAPVTMAEGAPSDQGL